MDYIVLFIRAILVCILVISLIQLSVWAVKSFLDLDVIIRITVLLFLGILAWDFHLVVYFIWPETAVITCDIWLDKSYHQEMTVQWYLYGMGRYLAELIWAVATSMLAGIVSYKLFKITVVFVLFFVTQFWFYCWDRNVSIWANFWVYLFMALMVFYLFIPDKKKTEAKYRRIDS